MKFGVRNYVRDPTSASNYGSGRAAWGSRRMREISLFETFLFFLSFLHLAYRSPQWTDFHDLYVSRCVFAQGSAFWWIFTFTSFILQKFENLHYDLWHLRMEI